MIKKRIEDLLNNIIEDENDITRRCFRAWIDGGYNGESSYRKNFERVEKANTLSKLRSFTIEQFVCFIAFEAGCSYGYAQENIVKYFSKDQLNFLTGELMEEIEEMFISFFPDSNRAPVTEAGENALC
jgi:hypothetical protein